MSRVVLLFLGLLSAPAFAQDAGAPVSAIAPAATSTLTREALLETVGRDLTAHFNLDGDLVLELLRPWTPPSAPAAQWQIALVDYPTTATSSMILRCRIAADGVVVAEPTIVLRASLWRDVWVTRSTLTAGNTFDAADLETRRVDMFRERDSLPATIGDRSYIFARGVAAGRVLTWRDITRRPLVRKGEAVEVSAVDGSLVVTMKAVAMENGAQGDTVRVRNPDSRKDFAALVVDENRVQVRF